VSVGGSNGVAMLIWRATETAFKGILGKRFQTTSGKQARILVKDLLVVGLSLDSDRTKT